MDAAPLLFIVFPPSDPLTFRTGRASSEAKVHSIFAQGAHHQKPGFSDALQCVPTLALRTVRPLSKAKVHSPFAQGALHQKPRFSDALQCVHYPRTSHCAP